MCRVKASSVKASSVELLLWYANCSGSSEAGSTEHRSIRTHSFADVHPFEGSGYIHDRKGECTHLFCSSRGSALCMGGVVSLETSIKIIKLVRREAAMFTIAGLFPLKPEMLLMTCHMFLALLVLNCSSTLAALMDW